jgi:serine/threonine protein kinase
MLGVCVDSPFFVMPLMQKGNLQTIINKSNADFPINIVIKYLTDTSRGIICEVLLCYYDTVLVGMAFVHGSKIVHGDLKPDNVLVDANDVAYVADFGISKIKTR